MCLVTMFPEILGVFIRNVFLFCIQPWLEQGAGVADLTFVREVAPPGDAFLSYAIFA